ncbi:TPA: hypothetical protein ACNEJR_003713 [Escherichia coli]
MELILIPALVLLVVYTLAKKLAIKMRQVPAYLRGTLRHYPALAISSPVVMACIFFVGIELGRFLLMLPNCIRYYFEYEWSDLFTIIGNHWNDDRFELFYGGSIPWLPLIVFCLIAAFAQREIIKYRQRTQ